MNVRRWKITVSGMGELEVMAEHMERTESGALHFFNYGRPGQRTQALIKANLWVYSEALDPAFDEIRLQPHFPRGCGKDVLDEIKHLLSDDYDPPPPYDEWHTDSVVREIACVLIRHALSNTETLEALFCKEEEHECAEKA